ncbi:DNA (cytosine-5-)-methyltransferase [Paenibacillus lignilyticus]|uniref:Cytosine-specific methyltransferase n=1 Tax=Paenibacillus lignilyticus TaxID=1172615 RepID=A0ABS5CK93_9BACL|nr:DNA (cytosine-5-)-methyltransferase [Paenibacillus lignilyticus]MBP3966247.1 DNA (cytosine-5-)-methyltransferase [Paenibacillus lignilyticus]
MTYKTIDLFAGIGGIRKGFELVGSFENVLSAEIDKYAQITYKKLFNEPDDHIFYDVTSPEYLTKIRELEEFDVLLGGFPCQAFSIAGKKEGFKDKIRGTLFFNIVETIEAKRPKAFLLENVEGLLRHKKGQTFQTIIETLTFALNYKIIGVSINDNGEPSFNPKDFLLNSKHFGVPQNRPRVYIMGFDNERYGAFYDSLPVTELPKTNNSIQTTLSEILEPSVTEEYYLASGYFDTLQKHRDRHKGKGNGYGYIIINDGTGPHVSNALLATGGSGKERNLIRQHNPEHSGKIVKGKKSAINTDGIRMMTEWEWGKLQGFIGDDTFTKEDFPPTMSRAQLYKQFGNSVTIPVIKELAKTLKENLNYLESEYQKALQIPPNISEQQVAAAYTNN